jgi:hypothetical protein
MPDSLSNNLGSQKRMAWTNQGIYLARHYITASIRQRGRFAPCRQITAAAASVAPPLSRNFKMIDETVLQVNGDVARTVSHRLR